MTNTYSDDEDFQTKLLEEIRCLRCVNERLLRVMDRAEFVDYQMEKFSGSPESRKNTQPPLNWQSFQPIIGDPVGSCGSGTATYDPCKFCSWPQTVRDVYHGVYVGDSPCEWCPHGNRVVCGTQ